MKKNRSSRRGRQHGRTRAARLVLGLLVVAAALAMPHGEPLRAVAPVVEYTYFPTARTDDGKFLNLAGRNLSTVAGDSISLVLGSDRDDPTLEFGIFDGDTGAFWDGGSQALKYTLYADPLGDGSGTTELDQWSGSVMPDNDWFTVTRPNVQNGPAQAASGHFLYRLVVVLPDANVASTAGAATTTSFKIRVRGTIALRATSGGVPQAFSFIGSLGANTASIIYPNWDPANMTSPTSLSNSTYDGTWRFFFDVPKQATSLSVWDGDMDHGGLSVGSSDADDADTANTLNDLVTPFIPAWATGTAALAEGAKGLGSPQDDTTSLPHVRAPSVRYDLLTPDNRIFSNNNPSGNREWEQFLVTTDASVAADHHTATILPSGTYELRMQGVDMGNLNALKFFFDAVGVTCSPDNPDDCDPVPPLRPDPIVGDTVWFDTNADGDQDVGEAGIPGVTLELINGDGLVQNTTATDANGQYQFTVSANHTYTVRVAASNLLATGPLAGWSSTTGGETQTRPVFEEDELDYDFGYAEQVLTGSVGDTVWRDSDGDGVYEPEVGEQPIAGVTVRLFNASNQLLGTRTTDAAGQYLFEQVAAGALSVAVTASTLPSGLVQTYDLDGTSTAHVAAFALAAGQHRRDVDFGYTPAPQPGTGTPGYWQNRNGQAAWPVDGLMLGGVWWTKSQLLAIMKGKEPVNVDEKMVFHLAPAKLNVAVGNYSSDVESWIRAADAWLALNPYGSRVKSNTSVGAQGIAIKDKLDAYNNGWLGAPARQ